LKSSARSTAPLNVILRREEIQNAGLIKINGAEWFVVQGMMPLLNSSRLDLEIIVEVNPTCLAQQGKQSEDLLSILSEAGFYAYCIENDYAALSYLSPATDERPTRIRTGIQSVTNIIFSWQDSEQF
jgi:hypothetical protein